MKLCELTTDAAFDALLAVAPDLEAILDDAEVTEAFLRAAGFTNGLRQVLHVLPPLIKGHRLAMYRVIAALNGMKEADVTEQLFFTTLKQVFELGADRDLLGFS